MVASPRLLILAPLRLEARALRRGVRSAAVVRTGMGPKAAARAGAGVVALAGGCPVAVAGFCGGMLPTGWLRAYRSLTRVGAALEVWADALGPREA